MKLFFCPFSTASEHAHLTPPLECGFLAQDSRSAIPDFADSGRDFVDVFVGWSEQSQCEAMDGLQT
jgi:hypothetical protein